MQCIKCGATIEEGYQVCKKCGTPVKNGNLNNNVKNNIEPKNTDNNTVNNTTVNISSNEPVIKDNDDTMVSSLNLESTNSYDISDYSDDDIDYSSRKSKLKYIIVGLIALMIVVIALVCVKFIPTKKTNVSPSEPINNIVTYNKVAFKDFIFSIPDKYVFSTKGDVLSISDYDGNEGMQIEISNGDYSKLVSKKDELSKALEKKGYVSTKADTRKEEGIEYLTMEVSASGQNILLAVTKGNSNVYFTISLFNKSNNIDYKLLEDLSSFLKLTEEIDSNNKLTSKNTYGKEFESIAK